MTVKLIRFDRLACVGTPVAGHTNYGTAEDYAEINIVGVGEHIYEYKGTVVEEETFEDVRESILLGHIYPSTRGTRFMIKWVVCDGFIAESLTTATIYHFNVDGVCTTNSSIGSLILNFKRVSTGKKKVLRKQG